MHQKKRKLFVLYSIPIWFRRKFNNFSKSCLCNKEKLYLVSYSIPLSCMVVLLLGGVVAINPSLPLKTSAVTIQDEWVVKEKDDKVESTNNVVEDEAVDDSFGGFDGDETELSEADTNAGISLLAASPANLSIAIADGTGGHGAGASAVVETSQDASTAYRSHDITITGSNLKSYTVSISGPANMTGPSGATETITGANGAYGESMLPDTWGYAWGNTTDNDAKLQYNTLSSSGTTLESGNGDDLNKVTIKKKLVFGASFSTAATPGNYTANVTLSAVSTPLATSFTVNNNYMQNMTKAACRDVAVGTTGILTDSRNGYASGTMIGSNGVTHNMNQYVIVKLPDGHCWMQENLRIGTSSTVSLASNDTNIAGSYTLPANNTGTWITDIVTEQTNRGQIRVGSNITTGVWKWQPLYGNYYSWCAATAGTCNEATSGGSIASAPGSICPKGWRLPSGGFGSQNDDFYKLFGDKGANLGNTEKLAIEAIKASPYYYPTSGRIGNDGELWGTSANGYFWTSTSYADDRAFSLTFDSSYLSPGTSSINYRYYGHSVRCVADY